MYYPENVQFRMRDMPMSDAEPRVFIVDDDLSVRQSLEGLIESAGWRTQSFASAEAFLTQPIEAAPSCLILDVSLPDINGLELQKRIAPDRLSMPIIFITAHANISMSVQAMKAGAVEFLTKPFNAETLLAAVRSAIERSKQMLAAEAESKSLQERHLSLSRREREVMELVVSGLLNKQVGGSLGISEITVKGHRGRVMRKMKAATFADLVKMAASLGIDPKNNVAQMPHPPSA